MQIETQPVLSLDSNEGVTSCMLSYKLGQNHCLRLIKKISYIIFQAPKYAFEYMNPYILSTQLKKQTLQIKIKNFVPLELSFFSRQCNEWASLVTQW